MSVPETSMDKDHGTIAGENDIGMAWKILRMETIAQAHSVQAPPDDEFRARVLRTDRCHVPTPLFRGVNVHHEVRLDTKKGFVCH